MIKLDKDDGLWVASINRPEKANSLTEDMLVELARIAEAAHEEARVLVLSGEGKVFSAGADLEAARAGLATSAVWERLSSAIAGFPGLSIAALNGTVAGGAMGMVLACDLRIAAQGAKAFYPVMKLGFLPQPSDPGRLTRLVGPSRAKMVLMGGQKVTDQEALSWGLFDRIVPGEELIPSVKEIAADTLGADAIHAATIKGMCRPAP